MLVLAVLTQASVSLLEAVIRLCLLGHLSWNSSTLDDFHHPPVTSYSEHPLPMVMAEVKEKKEKHQHSVISASFSWLNQVLYSVSESTVRLKWYSAYREESTQNPAPGNALVPYGW